MSLMQHKVGAEQHPKAHGLNDILKKTQCQTVYALSGKLLSLVPSVQGYGHGYTSRTIVQAWCEHSHSHWRRNILSCENSCFAGSLWDLGQRCLSLFNPTPALKRRSPEEADSFPSFEPLGSEAKDKYATHLLLVICSRCKQSNWCNYLMPICIGSF